MPSNLGQRFWKAVSAGHCAKYTTVADLTVAPNSEVLIPLQVKKIDTSNFRSNVTYPSRFIIPADKGGIYAIAGSVTWDATEITGTRTIILKANGTKKYEIPLTPVGNGQSPVQQVSALFQLSEGDYLELAVGSTATGNALIAASGAELFIYFVAPAENQLVVNCPSLESQAPVYAKVPFLRHFSGSDVGGEPWNLHGDWDGGSQMWVKPYYLDTNNTRTNVYGFKPGAVYGARFKTDGTGDMWSHWEIYTNNFSNLLGASAQVLTPGGGTRVADMGFILIPNDWDPCTDTQLLFNRSRNDYFNDFEIYEII